MKHRRALDSVWLATFFSWKLYASSEIIINVCCNIRWICLLGKRKKRRYKLFPLSFLLCGTELLFFLITDKLLCFSTKVLWIGCTWWGYKWVFITSFTFMTFNCIIVWQSLFMHDITLFHKTVVLLSFLVIYPSQSATFWAKHCRMQIIFHSFLYLKNG